MPATLTTWFLEMNSPDELVPAAVPEPFVTVNRMEEVSPEFCRYLYCAVGTHWHWNDRVNWSYQQWHEWMSLDNVSLWYGMVRGVPFGYYELEGQQDGAIKLLYFGCIPQFYGRKLGGYLLTHAVKTMWQNGAGRIWLHTCSLDHVNALPNYTSRGFTLVKTERTDLVHLQSAPEAWPGSRFRVRHGRYA